MVVLEAVSREGVVMGVASEAGPVDQDVVDMAAEAADTAVDSAEPQGPCLPLVELRLMCSAE